MFMLNYRRDCEGFHLTLQGVEQGGYIVLLSNSPSLRRNYGYSNLSIEIFILLTFHGWNRRLGRINVNEWFLRFKWLPLLHLPEVKPLIKCF